MVLAQSARSNPDYLQTVLPVFYLGTNHSSFEPLNKPSVKTERDAVTEEKSQEVSGEG